MINIEDTKKDLVKKINNSNGFTDLEKSLLIEGIRGRENLVLAGCQPLKNDSCERCSNNPKNGGDGICHCTLGLPSIT